MKIIKLFYNPYSERITDLAFWCIAVLIFVAGVIAADKYGSWTCSNYQKVTGHEVKYINFDACYVKTPEGNFVRYDKGYRTLN